MPPPTDADAAADTRRLVQSALHALRLLDDARTDNVGLSPLSKSLLQVAEEGTRHLPRPPGAGAAPKPPKAFDEVRSELQKILKLVAEVLRALLEKWPSHYGVFREGPYISDLALLSERINLLLRGGTVPHDSSLESLDSVERLIKTYMAQLWWTRHIGDEASPKWGTFQKAFIEQFGEQPEDAMDILHKALCQDLCCPGPIGIIKANAIAAAAAAAEAGGGAMDVATGASPAASPRAAASAAAAGGMMDAAGDVRMEAADADAPAVPPEGASRSASGHPAAMSLQDHKISAWRYNALVEGVCGATDADSTSGSNSGSDGGSCGAGGLPGLYKAYQKITDPGKLVYGMGVVEDDQAAQQQEVPLIMEGLLGLRVRQICCGGQHAAVLTEQGHIYTWGRGGFGRLGHGSSDHITNPRRVSKLVGVPCMQVACGFAYTAAVTTNGILYTWGAGENGRLGLNDIDDRLEPALVEALAMAARVKQVYAGSVHTCVLTVWGDVYTFGKHEYTGHGLENDVLVPTLLDGFGGRPVRQISVGPGGYHTIALTESEEVYTWGHNRVGQLGYTNSDVVPRNVEGAYFLPRPQLVENLSFKRVMHVVAGWGHSAALTTSGEIYICGRNYQGQLGLGPPNSFPRNERDHPFQPTFAEVERLRGQRAAQIACGGEHSVVITEGGEMYSFGAGSRGQLGLPGSPNSEHYPKLVHFFKRARQEVLQVACGNNCTLVLTGLPQQNTLFERCVRVVQNDPNLLSHLDMLPGTVAQTVKDYKF